MIKTYQIYLLFVIDLSYSIMYIKLMLNESYGHLFTEQTYYVRFHTLCQCKSGTYLVLLFMWQLSLPIVNGNMSIVDLRLSNTTI